MMHKLVLSLLFLATALAIVPKSLSPDYTLCKRSDPGLNNCLKSAIQSAITLLTHGDKHLGILALDPLRITKLSINQGTGPVAVNLTFFDLDIDGIRKITIDSVEAKLEGPKPELFLRVSADQPLILKGQYMIDGNVLFLPISGKGDAQLDFVGVNASIDLKMKKVKNNGHTYAVPQELIFSLNPKNLIIKLENLYEGNKELGDHMNRFLNDEWETVYGELQDSIQKGFAGAVIEIITRLFTKIPFNSIFLK
ncbi:protein takeout-like [Athalia rosae]|uniref:protein takeout-like n=1 Tax=Athalia rosae TaxID=37344 RepID=UPI002033CC03|nr:protein takeout-like [Athalia rosae]